MKRAMRTFGILFGLTTACSMQAELDAESSAFLAPDGKSDTGGIAEGTVEAYGVLRIANGLSESDLSGPVGIHPTAAENIVEARNQRGVFESLADLDNVPNVGPYAFARMLEYARGIGIVPILDPILDGDEDGGMGLIPDVDGGMVDVDGGDFDGGPGDMDGGMVDVDGGDMDGGAGDMDGGMVDVDGGDMDGGAGDMDGGMVDVDGGPGVADFDGVLARLIAWNPSINPGLLQDALLAFEPDACEGASDFDATAQARIAADEPEYFLLARVGEGSPLDPAALYTALYLNPESMEALHGNVTVYDSGVMGGSGTLALVDSSGASTSCGASSCGGYAIREADGVDRLVSVGEPNNALDFQIVRKTSQCMVFAKTMQFINRSTMQPFDVEVRTMVRY